MVCTLVSSLVLSTAKNIHPRILTQVPKHRPPRLKWLVVAYHYSPVGGHTSKVRHITTLPATVRLQGYVQANLHRLTYHITQVTVFTASAVEECFGKASLTVRGLNNSLMCVMNHCKRV